MEGQSPATHINYTRADFRALRERLGVSLKNLATTLGCDKKYLAHMERGRDDDPMPFEKQFSALEDIEARFEPGVERIMADALGDPEVLASGRAVLPYYNDQDEYRLVRADGDFYTMENARLREAAERLRARGLAVEHRFACEGGVFYGRPVRCTRAGYRAWREALGVSLDDLTEILGCSRRFLCHIERGKPGDPVPYEKQVAPFRDIEARFREVVEQLVEEAACGLAPGGVAVLPYYRDQEDYAQHCPRADAGEPYAWENARLREAGKRLADKGIEVEYRFFAERDVEYTDPSDDE